MNCRPSIMGATKFVMWLKYRTAWLQTLPSLKTREYCDWPSKWVFCLVLVFESILTKTKVSRTASHLSLPSLITRTGFILIVMSKQQKCMTEFDFCRNACATSSSRRSTRSKTAAGRIICASEWIWLPSAVPRRFKGKSTEVLILAAGLSSMIQPDHSSICLVMIGIYCNAKGYLSESLDRDLSKKAERCQSLWYTKSRTSLPPVC